MGAFGFGTDSARCELVVCLEAAWGHYTVVVYRHAK
jgi:hypothetical protein